jgi:hypothetical protein
MLVIKPDAITAILSLRAEDAVDALSRKALWDSRGFSNRGDTMKGDLFVMTAGMGRLAL